MFKDRDMKKDTKKELTPVEWLAGWLLRHNFVDDSLVVRQAIKKALDMESKRK